jgi:integrase
MSTQAVVAKERRPKSKQRGIQKLPDGAYQVAVMAPHVCRKLSFVRGGRRYEPCPNPCPREGQRELHRERAPSYSEALKILNARRAAVDKDEALPVAEALTFETLIAGLEHDHALHHRRSALKLHHLRRAFAGLKESALTKNRVERYILARQASGAADSTIYQECASLKHALVLAGKWVKGRFSVPQVNNVVECFFTVPELDQLYRLLPASLRLAVEFAALTGLRAGNVFGLKWSDIDFGEGEITLPGVAMKNGEAWSMPFAHRSRLETLLRAQQRVTGESDHVFTRKGLRTAWDKAVGEHGLNKWGRQGTTKVRPRFHDLRHSFCQHLTDAGVDARTIQELGAWKTQNMLARYSIRTDEAKRAAQQVQAEYVEAKRRDAAKVSRVVDLRRRSA